MTQAVLDRFREALERRRQNLIAWLQETSAESNRRTLSQSAKADVIADVDDALHRIEEGRFGRCEQCGDDVETDLLQFDFTACVCLDHLNERQKRELENDLELAAKVQQHLFPCCAPALTGIDIAAHNLPAEILSGDYYDFFVSPSKEQGIAIADVMGKGVQASMLMANLQASLRILGEQNDEPHQLATRLNELFRHNLRQVRFISLFLVAINTERRTLRYCNAGHNPPLLYESSTGTAHWMRPTGPALGLVRSPRYSSVHLEYEPGDVLVLYTDGLAEARRSDGCEFGTERLADFVQNNPDLSAEAMLTGIWRTLHEHTNGTRRDDTTLVVVRFND